MEPSLILAIAAIGGNGLLAVGLIATWSKNGKSQAVKYGELKNEVGNTGGKVDTLTKTVSDLDKKVGKYQEISARQDERLKGTEQDIKELKRT